MKNYILFYDLLLQHQLANRPKLMSSFTAWLPPAAAAEIQFIKLRIP